MKNKILLLQLFFTVIFFAQNNEEKVTTVDSVDLEKYVGTWFEISKIPNSFQDQCIKNTTATYELNEDGEIIVTNKCIDGDGELEDAEGLAKVVNKETNAKLEVSFVSILGWHLFWGDYWIIGLDQNYQYVCVGTPSKKYGWILSRTNQMQKSDLENCYKIFEANGYERNKFEKTIQE